MKFALFSASLLVCMTWACFDYGQSYVTCFAICLLLQSCLSVQSVPYVCLEPACICKQLCVQTHSNCKLKLTSLHYLGPSNIESEAATDYTGAMPRRNLTTWKQTKQPRTQIMEGASAVRVLCHTWRDLHQPLPPVAHKRLSHWTCKKTTLRSAVAQKACLPSLMNPVKNKGPIRRPILAESERHIPEKCNTP